MLMNEESDKHLNRKIKRSINDNKITEPVWRNKKRNK